MSNKADLKSVRTAKTLLKPHVPRMNELAQRALLGDVKGRSSLELRIILPTFALGAMGSLLTLLLTDLRHLGPLKIIGPMVGSFILALVIVLAVDVTRERRARKSLRGLPVGLRNPLVDVLGEPAFQRTLRLEISLTESQGLGDYRTSALGRPELPEALGTVEVTSERKVHVTRMIEVTPNSTHAVVEWTVAVLSKLNAVQDAVPQRGKARAKCP